METRKREWAVSELQISYKPAKKTVQVTDSLTANKFLQLQWDPQLLHIREQFYAIYLNRENEIVCWRLISTGNNKGCMVDMPLLTSIITRQNIARVIVAHNHPSGNVLPSNNDIYFTEHLESLLKDFDAELIDHLIISANDYYSFADDLLIKNDRPINYNYPSTEPRFTLTF